MCGLSGVVVTHPELTSPLITKMIFSLLMEENDFRGGHSWGFWGNGIAPYRQLGVYKANREDLHKHLEGYSFNMKPNTKQERISYLFGHTRYGTHGEKNVANAHPFEISNLILAHNGVVEVDGYGFKDHAVDSGRIAQAIVEHGWVKGMDKVSGSCALLVSVDDTIMIYRHNQVLHHAQFPWGVVISSTEQDLELVVTKKLGLPDMIGKIEKVPEDTFIQPGWGNIALPAPCGKPVYKAWSREDLAEWRKQYQDEQDEYTNHYGGRSAGFGFGAGQGDSGSFDRTCRGGQRQPLPLDTRYGRTTGLESQGSKELRTIDAKGGQHKTKRERKAARQAARSAKRPQPDVPSLYDSPTDDEVLELCDYCGHGNCAADTFYVEVEWDKEPMTMCFDCVMEEIAATGTIHVIARLSECELETVETIDAVPISSSSDSDPQPN